MAEHRPCPEESVVNIHGEHYPCHTMDLMDDESVDHSGWAHSNAEAGAVWL